MSNDKENSDLIKLANLSADGQLKDSNLDTENDLMEAFNLINNVRNSFKQAIPKTPESHPIQADDSWGPLKLINKIGQGGMGQVFLAYDSVLDREVAVKFLNQNSSQYISSENFISEARRIAKVRHPNVLAVFGANTYNNTTGFWCDYINGDTLDEHVKQKQSNQQILGIAEDLALAVAEVHKNQIIHGDIKPSNVMIDKHQKAILMDFGSGFELQQQDTLLTSSTPLIMAPELFTGEIKTKASDTYALGVLFYFLSSNGHYPFKAQSLSELQSTVLNNPKIDLKKINGSKSWKQLIAKMLQVKAQDRPSIQEVYTQISNIIRAPIVRNKKIAIYSVLAFLLATSIILTYSYLNLKKQQLKTQSALNETSEVNSLMFNLLSSVSPTSKGKDVLMVDVINDLIQATKESTNISNNNKAKTLFTLAHSLKNLNQLDNASHLIDEISNYSDINDLIKIQIMYAKAEFQLNTQLSKQSYEKAQKVLDEAKALLNSMPKKDLEINAKLHYFQALIYDKAIEKDKAIAELNLALDYWLNQKPTKNSNHHKGLIYLLLGNIHSSKSKFKESLEYYKKAEQNFESYDQKTNSNLLVIKNNIAEIYSQTGKTQEAISIYQELIETGKIFLGEKHRNILIYKLNYASSLNDNKQPLEAIKVIDETLPEIIKQFGETSMASIIIQSTKANALKNIKKYKESITLYNTLIEMSIEQFG